MPHLLKHFTERVTYLCSESQQDPDDLSPGNHIWVFSKTMPVKHHGIFIGRDNYSQTVIHYSKEGTAG